MFGDLLSIPELNDSKTGLAGPDYGIGFLPEPVKEEIQKYN